jgi:transposase-like protein
MHSLAAVTIYRVFYKFLGLNQSFPKLFYLALINISKKWTMPLRDWKPALNRFTIQFEERMPQQ